MRRSASTLWLLCAFLVAGYFCLKNLRTWPARIFYPGEESYEGVVLAETLHLRQGVPIYDPATTDHYDAATYGPLYYFVGGRLLGDELSYSPLRLLSAFGMLGCAVGCSLLAFWLSRSYQAACLAAIVFLAFGMVTRHGIKGLSDGLALLLMFAGFLLAYKFQNSRALLLSVPFFLAGTYCKPQYLAGPLAAAVFLLWERRYRLAAYFVGLLAFGGLGLFVLFQSVVFSGQSFWRHFVLSQAALFSWHRFGQAVFILVFLLALPLLFSIEYLRSNSNRLLACYLFFAVVLGAVTYSKDGSGIHYFFESALAVSVILSVAIVRQINAQPYRAYLVPVLALMLVAGQWWSNNPPPRPIDVAKHNAMQSFLRQHFASHAQSLSPSPGELLQAGLETPYSGLFQLVQLAHRGLVSDRELADKIRSRRFAVIVLGIDLAEEKEPYWLNFYLTPTLIDAINQSYSITTSLDMPAPEQQRAQDRFYIYVPK